MQVCANRRIGTLPKLFAFNRSQDKQHLRQRARSQRDVREVRQSIEESVRVSLMLCQFRWSRRLVQQIHQLFTRCIIPSIRRLSYLVSHSTNLFPLTTTSSVIWVIFHVIDGQKATTLHNSILFISVFIYPLMNCIANDLWQSYYFVIIYLIPMQFWFNIILGNK